MVVETAEFLSELIPQNPPDADQTIEMDDHIRVIKNALLNTFNGSGGDVFDEALTVSREVIDTWTSRLTELESINAGIISPVLGSRVFSAVTGETVSFTAVGFKPRTIIAWAQGHAIGENNSGFAHIGIATWNDVADQSYSKSFAGRFSADPSVSHFSDLMTVFLAIDSSLVNRQLFVESVNDDGFDLKVEFSGGEVDLIYLAFP